MSRPKDNGGGIAPLLVPYSSCGEVAFLGYRNKHLMMGVEIREMCLSSSEMQKKCLSQVESYREPTETSMFSMELFYKMDVSIWLFQLKDSSFLH